MTSLYLRLAGPLQSWAGPRLSGNVVNTNPLPPRRSLEGLIAAALGAPREEFPKWLSEVAIQVRVDNAGSIISEFQTINPRDEDLDFQKRIHLALTGKSWSSASHFTPDAQKGTAIVNRTYVSGGEFLVSLSHDTKTVELFQAFRRPIYSPYLGKKAFTPVFPFLLGYGEDELLSGDLPVFEAEPEKTPFLDYFEQADQQSGVETKRLRIKKYPQSAGEQPFVTAPIVRERQEWLKTIRRLLTVS